MTAADLEALAERLMLGEFTTADLHAAARCARGWAKVEELLADASQPIELFGYRGRPLPWALYSGPNNGQRRTVAPTALEAVEAAEVGK